MIWLLSAIAFLGLLLGVRLFSLKRQLRTVTAQLNERTKENSERKVTVAFIDNDLTELAAAVNRNLELQKKLRIDVRKNDLQLKESIANLSHDLRTPLTSILGYLQLARAPQCPEEKRNEYLKIVSDKADSLKAMINRLYELSVLDVQEAALKKEKIDLNLLLREVLAGQYELLKKSGIDLDVNLPNFPVWITADKVALTRIIQNLLGNSGRYAKERLKIELTTASSCAFLSVSNPAPQLNAEDVEHLFERFYTADKSRNSGGSGLGLYIVKKLIEKMDGNITAGLCDDVLTIKVGFKLSQ